MGAKKGIFDDEWDIPRGRRGKQDRVNLDQTKRSGGRNTQGGIAGSSQQPNFHLSMSVISRGKGHSATAAAAYRTGSLIVDERTGDIHNYRNKTRVEYSEIVAPLGSPVWAMDRSALWNEAEKKERVNGCVAREWQIAIPLGFTELQAISLAKELSEEIVERHGIVVEFSIHKDNPKNWDGSEKGASGYHAHILGTTRRVGYDGFGEKSRELDDRKPQPERNNKSRGQEEVIWWRARFAALANHALERYGRIERVDHRSNLARGIMRLAQPKLGPALTKMARENNITCEHPGRSEVMSRWKNASEDWSCLIELGNVSRELCEVKSELVTQQAEVKKLTKALVRKGSPLNVVKVGQFSDLTLDAKQITKMQQEAAQLYPGRSDKQDEYVKIFSLAVVEAKNRFPANKIAQVQFINEVWTRMGEVRRKIKRATLVKSVLDTQVGDIELGKTNQKNGEKDR